MNSWRDLYQKQVFGILAVASEQEPLTALVAYAPDPETPVFWLHLSRLGRQQEILLAGRTAVSLLVPEIPADGRLNLAGPRLTLQGDARHVPVHDSEYAPGRAVYAEQHPELAMTFSFPDFALFSVRIRGGRYVAGFGRIEEITL